MKQALAALLLIACSSPSKPPASPPQPEPMPEAKPAVVETPPPKQEVVEDPYLWLEDVTGEKSLAWAREQNKKSKGELEAQAGFATTRDRIRGILDSKDKIPGVQKRGNFYYNFW